MKKVKVVPKRDYDINVTDTENDNNGGAGAAGQLDSESGSPPATKSEVHGSLLGLVFRRGRC
jgi:hypothetical protein